MKASHRGRSKVSADSIPKKRNAMKKNKTGSENNHEPESNSAIHQIHEFSPNDAENFTCSLLEWYNKEKRDLPWRSLSTDLTSHDRAYAVLVSEIMLQQTQVVTVLQYYTKWMRCWPTFGHLAQASLDDVNQVWSGLGYYSRAKRLWEAGRKVTFELKGKVPQTSKELQEELPGVGRYTAGAVASIVFGEKVPAVDGNVIRVLSRVRCIGADCTSKVVTDYVWKVSDQIVSKEYPGNFNQAMMDLGATICTPKKPLCDRCPVSHLCLAYQRVKSSNPLKEISLQKLKPLGGDIEDVPCHLCLNDPWDSNQGVMNFPRKSKKAPPRNEVSLVCIIFKNDDDDVQKFLLCQRPEGGLLGGLWEFPSLLLPGPLEDNVEKELSVLKKDLLFNQWGLDESSLSSPLRVAAVPHIFSHIHKLYVVYCATLSSTCDINNKNQVKTKWVTSDQFLTSAISTAMKKVFSAFSDRKKTAVSSRKRLRSTSNSTPESASKKVTDFFKRAPKT